MTIVFADCLISIREKLIKYLEIEGAGRQIFRTDSLRATLEILQRYDADLLLIDEQLIDNRHDDLLNMLKGANEKLILILLTNYSNSKYRQADQAFQFDYIFDKHSELKKLKLFLDGFINIYSKQNGTTR